MGDMRWAWWRQSNAWNEVVATECFLGWGKPVRGCMVCCHLGTYRNFNVYYLNCASWAAFVGLARNGNGMMGWCHSLKPHHMHNACGGLMIFCLTVANVDDRNLRVKWGCVHE